MRSCYLLEESADHGHAKRPGRLLPVEAIPAHRIFLVPEHPGRKDAVEKGLHQGRTEEVIPPAPLEMDTEGLFEGLPDDGKGRELSPLDPGSGIPRIGGKEPCDIFGSLQACSLEQCPAQVLQEPLAVLVDRRSRIPNQNPEFVLVLRQPVALPVNNLASGSLPTRMNSR